MARNWKSGQKWKETEKVKKYDKKLKKLRKWQKTEKSQEKWKETVKVKVDKIARRSKREASRLKVSSTVEIFCNRSGFWTITRSKYKINCDNINH